MKRPRKITHCIAAILTVLCAASPLRADTAFDTANRAFAEGRYADSVQAYEVILKRDGYSPAVLFNLGNAHLRANQPGEAILDYERAHWLAPRDADIAANLRLARQRASVPAADGSWIENAAGLFAPNTWAWVGSAALLAACVGIVGMQWRPHRRAVFGLLTAAGAVVVFTAVGAIAVDAGQLRRAILPAKDTAALLSPFDGAKTVFEFPAGQAVTVEKTHGEYEWVRDAAGHSGWVASRRVGRIVPDTNVG